MIFEAIINAGTAIFTAILSLFNIPHIGEDLNIVMSFFNDYIFSSFYFINIFLPIKYYAILLGLTVAVILAEDIYSFVMWIVRKIPMAGMS